MEPSCSRRYRSHGAPSSLTRLSFLRRSNCALSSHLPWPVSLITASSGNLVSHLAAASHFSMGSSLLRSQTRRPRSRAELKERCVCSAVLLCFVLFLFLFFFCF